MTETGFSDPPQTDPPQAEVAETAETETAQPETASAETAPIETATPEPGTAETAPAETAQPNAAELEAARVQATARRSRIRRNVLRWTGAIVLTLAVGGGIAYGISLPQRTDIPGLRTASDGRYDFPALTLPTLPAGQPAPSASANQEAQQHLADIRRLLLPHPIGATAPHAKADGWFGNAYKLFSGSAVKSTLAQYGLRHTATTTWTTGDGATTTIYLLQFSDGPAADQAAGKLSAQAGSSTVSMSGAINGVPSGTTSTSVTPATAATGDYSLVKAPGKTTRYGAFVSGDVFALVIESGPANLPAAPFLQTLDLQAELLQ